MPRVSAELARPTGLPIPPVLSRWSPKSPREVPSFTTLPAALAAAATNKPWQINCQISDARVPECLSVSLPAPSSLPLFLSSSVVSTPAVRTSRAAWGLLIDGGGGDFVTGGGYAGTSNEWRIRRGLVSPVPLLPIRRSARSKCYLVTLKYFGTKLVSENDRPCRP